MEICTFADGTKSSNHVDAASDVVGVWILRCLHLKIEVTEMEDRVVIG